MNDNKEQKLEKYLQRLHELAEVPIDTAKSLRLYIRSAESVYKQACIYRGEGDLEKAFILFLKYSNLVLKELPKHPEYDKNIGAVAGLRGNVMTALSVLETSKSMLLERFQEVEVMRERQMARDRELSEARRRDQEARELAERASRHQEEARRQRFIEMQKLDLTNQQCILDKSDDGTLDYLDALPPVMKPMNGTSNISAIPVISYPPPPTIPSFDIPITKPFSPPPPSLPTAPLQKKTKYRLENGMPLRTVHVPQSIISRFMDVAAPNTRRNLESCGVLAGLLAHDEFTITTLIIPKQSATSDTVTMLNEEDIFDVQDKRDLLTLGWIHTHPTQSCFMSSVDLHTHFPYQLLMAEAIAIVVAPTQSPNYGVFRLTDPPGIGIVSKCPHRGFHHHNSSNSSDKDIYREISGPDGHAKFCPSIPLEVIDLR